MDMSMSPHNLHPILIRPAHAGDVDALARLATLDSKRALDGSVIVAEAEGVLLAAVDSESGQSIADPFRPTADVVDLLNQHAGRRRPLRRLRIGRLHTA
jgi:hypothetical protein